MHLHQYLSEAEKQYHLRLKTIVPLDDAAMDRIEFAVSKYLPTAISRPKKTIIQRQPMEFPDVQNAEVYIVDLSFSLPVAPPVLRDDIRKALNTADSLVFVRNQYSPGEVEIARINALADIEAEAEAKKLSLVATLDDDDYLEAESTDNAALFGNSYNAAFLGYLSSVQKERAAKADKIDTAPFKWLGVGEPTVDENAQDPADFNAHIAGSPKVAPPAAATPNVNKSVVGHYGLTGANQLRRLYQDEKGNRVVLARSLGDA